MKTLGHRAMRAACIAVLTLAAGACQAASDHERNVGAQVEQLCDPRSLATLGRFVHVDNFREPALGQEPDATAMVAASACRAAPAHHGRLVAAAYRSGHDNDLLLVIAVIDGATGQVGSNFKANLDSDPAVKVVSGSLWLDTAAYDLAPGVRAFGLDITSGLPRGCAAGGSGARRSLFVSQGRFIRPVLQDLPMSEWNLIQRGRSACTDSSAPDLTITENFAATLAPAPTSTRGYRDLAVTGLATRDDGSVDERPPFHALLKWDGRVYSLVEQQQAWTIWKQ
ncbi:hypothetical protein [Scleromatobacter humisilvae]|uniref:Uncharacterized protein n=1 Tax=Scleromatobacter humisilvae TaxID=2897159 RepID=A0A9X1YRW9_9BURK|nr:hypothetical protein [Scleromatobacter humisilvae]MCK9687681.1 hypothetical protein [Scleromatobacter humisilvae]